MSWHDNATPSLWQAGALPMGKSGTHYKVRPLAEAVNLKLHVSMFVAPHAIIIRPRHMMPMELQGAVGIHFLV